MDVERYNAIRDLIQDAPSVDDVAHGMGERLSRIHWLAGYDARDIKFVMGGDGLGDVTFFVIDFNQVHTRCCLRRVLTTGLIVSR